MTLTTRPGGLFLNQRREAISHNRTQIGIDYVTVEQLTASTWRLGLHFIPAAADDPIVRGKTVVPDPPLTASRVAVAGVSPVVATNVQVLSVENDHAHGTLVWVTVGLADGGAGAHTLPRYELTISGYGNLDPFFDSALFSLSTVVTADFGPQPATTAPAPATPPPPIDYLSKDYESFRQVMLDRLSFLIPEWSEGSPADVGVTLVEVMAYAADLLSYYQDAIATEAYLETARQRISIRRHARLLDYTVHEGCNARVWVHFDVGRQKRLARGTQLLTNPGVQEMAVRITSAQYEQAVNQGAAVFETLYDADLYPGQNELWFYTWGAATSRIPAGATSATLLVDPRFVPRWQGEPHLQAGDVLVFEQLPGGQAGSPIDPAGRHAVRLTSVRPTVDALGGQMAGEQELGAVAIVEISWAPADALPVPFDIVALDPLTLPGTVDPTTVRTSIARGNNVLADHGRPVGPECLPRVDVGRLYRPTLGQVNLTFRVAFDPAEARTQPAVDATVQDPRAALPVVCLKLSGMRWHARRDLLASSWSSRDFVVEMESDRVAHLRFGDGTYGEKPPVGATLKATYRVGNGPGGNVGAETIVHYLPQHLDQHRQSDHHHDDAIRQVVNLLPAQGGIGPEPIEQVRLNAPQALHTQDRCVTDDDYAEIARRFPSVRQAHASRQWTGSWTTIFLAIDRQGSLPVDCQFQRMLGRWMQPYLLVGTDLEIVPPDFVSLQIVLTVHVSAGHYPDLVKQLLLEAFSSTPLPDGRIGFFDPSRFTFGQSVYLSQVVACACAVPGVAWVEVEQFSRWQDPSPLDLAREEIAIGPSEIARLSNDPNAPELGQISFTMVESARS